MCNCDQTEAFEEMMNVLVSNIANADLRFVPTNTAIGCRQRTESDCKTLSKPITSQPARYSTIWTGARTIPHVITAHSKDHHTQQKNQGQRKSSCHLLNKLKC